MIEPLSVAVSILTILGAGGQISKGLKRLLTLKLAPDILCALNNEVADLQLLVAESQELLRGASDYVDTKPPASMVRTLEHVKDELLALEGFLVYRLSNIDSEARPPIRVDRSRFLYSHRNIEIFKDRIREQRIALVSAMNLWNT